MSEQGGAGRYTRSFNGMAGAMLFLVVIVVGVFVLRDLVFGTPEQPRPAAIDYLGDVQGLQRAGADLVYPESLPTGWIVTEVGAGGTEEPSYRINLYTGEDAFVGIRQESAEGVTLDDMLTRYVDESTSSEEPLESVGALAPTWEGWSDQGGDAAYSAVVDGSIVLVFGSVSAEELAGLVELLDTTEVATS